MTKRTIQLNEIATQFCTTVAKQFSRWNRKKGEKRREEENKDGKRKKWTDFEDHSNARISTGISILEWG